MRRKRTSSTTHPPIIETTMREQRGNFTLPEADLPAIRPNKDREQGAEDQ